MAYTTPDVYVKEVSTLPPSVAQVATAIPAFVGYVEYALNAKGEKVAVADTPVIRRISSLLDYEQYFGGPAKLSGTVKVDGGKAIFTKASDNAADKFFLYHALKHFFANGGGEAYIVAVGDYVDTPSSAAVVKGIAATEVLDEVTLLLAPEAAGFADYYSNVVSEMLLQASKLGDRFVLIDAANVVNPDEMATALRNGVTGTVDKIKYGAAYYPHLKTTLSHSIDDVHIKLDGVTGYDTLAALKAAAAGSQVCQQILTVLAAEPIVLPPSAAVAGVYAQTDGSRGVWKAPANVPLAMVSDTTRTLTNDEQGRLNVDATSGKSINAIRAFTGKGILVWGARTLAGNDNEWRYVNVRRLFNMVEESVKKATAFAVFEPNTPMTWLKVKSMIDSYLTGLWKDGALFGDTAEQAFFITVGLGTTMTEDDILNGRLNIKIGLAAVRPAEFIELAFSHKTISA